MRGTSLPWVALQKQKLPNAELRKLQKSENQRHHSAAATLCANCEKVGDPIATVLGRSIQNLIDNPRRVV
jgi:hypothetical protein